MRYYIQGKEVKHATSSKYLDITIDEHLKWNDHVKSVVSKVNKIKGFLQRNIKYCPSIVKARCHNSMIRPTLEHASAIWSPYTQKNIDLFRSSAKTISEV